MPSATSVSLFQLTGKGSLERKKIRRYLNTNTDFFRQSEIILSERHFDFLKISNFVLRIHVSILSQHFLFEDNFPAG